MKNQTTVPPAGVDELKEKLYRQIFDSVSHDLKTPLATMIGSLEILSQMKDRISKENAERLVKSALGEAYRLDSFITNILDMAKLESGLVTARKELCPAEILLKECIARAHVKNATLSLLSSSQTNLIFLTDPALFCRALMLILDNALRHGASASGNAVVDISYGVEKEHLRFTIRDYGPGIKTGNEEAIFEKYKRYNRADSQKAGTGLGLIICRHILRLLDASVEASNHPHGGAVFTISMPTQQ